MQQIFPWLLLASLPAVTCCVVWYCAIFLGRKPLPPGPRGRYPFLGISMPSERPWITAAQWAEQYGPLMYTQIGRRDYIWISSGDVARDLLDKRASIYSDRPASYAGNIVSGNRRSVLMHYGPEWRRVRKVFNNLVTAKKCDEYVKIQEREAIATLQDIKDKPNTWRAQFHRYALSTATSIAYGRRVFSDNDPLANDIKIFMENFSHAMRPGRYIAESIPILQYLPKFLQPWLPELEKFRSFELEMTLRLYREAKADSEAHPDRKSVSRDLLREFGDEIDELQAATVCSEVLGVGSETTASSLQATIHALVNYPEVVQRAHEELDRVIGRGRMPTWEDEGSLPYIRAIVKEQQRWRTIAPLSFARCAMAEDEYHGYRIPKGSTILVNTWAIHASADRYTDPAVFDPSRFLNHRLGASAYANSGDVAARDHFSYGGGKRICVGLHLAERGLFTMTARLLHLMTVRPSLDVDGNPMRVNVDAYTTGLVSVPKAFDARIEIRNREVGLLLEKEWTTLFGNGDVERWN